MKLFKRVQSIRQNVNYFCDPKNFSYNLNMSKILKCSHCNKPATVHLTQIINNKIIKIDLCESCAQAKGVTDPSGFSLADFLNKQQLSSDVKEKQITCPECGFTTADFRRTGRIGLCAMLS